MMNLKEIKELIELISEKGFAEFEIERQGFRLRVSRFKDGDPPPPPVASPSIIISPALHSAPEVSAAPVSRVDASAGEPPPGLESHHNSQAPASPAPAAEGKVHQITSPIVGTFYRAASPGSPPFVNVGDHVEPDTVVCIIEAMKLMNEILAETSGEVGVIYAENGQAVEYGQPLFGIKR